MQPKTISGLNSAVLAIIALALFSVQPALGQDSNEDLRPFQAMIAEQNNQGNFQGALAATQNLVEHVRATRGQSDPQYARAIQLLGFAYDNLGEADLAERHLTASVELVSRSIAPDHPAIARFRLSLADFLVRNDRIDKAREMLPGIHAELKAKLGDSDRGTQLAAQRLAEIYSLGGEANAASDLYRRLLETRQSELGPAHPETIGTATDLALHITRSSGDHSRAAQMLSATYDTVEGTGADRASARRRLDYAFGILYMDWGLFPDAERSFRRALEGVSETDNAAFAMPLNGLAGALLRQDRTAEAIPMYERLIALTEAQNRGGKPAIIDPTGLRINMLTAYSAAGDTEKSLAIARPLLEQLDNGSLEVSPDLELLLLEQSGKLAFELGEFQRAGQLYTLALQRARAMPNLPQRRLLSLQINTLDAIVMVGEGRRALPHMRQLMHEQGRLIGMSHPEALQTAMKFSRLLLQLNEPTDEAKTVTESVIYGVFASEAASLHHALPDDNARARRQFGFGAAYALHLEALWREVERSPGTLSYNRYGAFESMQQSMAGENDLAIAQMTTRRAASLQGGALGQMIDTRQQLQQDIADNRRESDRLVGSSDPGQQIRLDQLRTDLTELGRRYATTQARLQDKFPAYFDLIRPDPLTLSDANRLLGPDEAVLLMHPFEFGTHVMVVTSEEDELVWHKSSLNAEEIARDVGLLREALDQEVDRQTGEYEFPFDRELAHRLFGQLVEPVEEALAAKKHVFFAGSGALSSLPLGVLVTETPHGDEYDPQALRDTAWLADRWALVQIPSLQSLGMLRRLQAMETRENGPGRLFDGFGNPVLAPVEPGAARRGATSFNAVFQRKADNQGEDQVSVEALRALASLPGSAAELEAIRSALGAPAESVRLGDAATEKAVLSADLSQTRILAFATHGLLAGDLDGLAEPGLVFTPPDRADGGLDGLLTASEIAAMNLNAEWVILSACNTAGGDAPGAPGLSGLARAFFYAGARNLLASHWPVRDDIVPTITTETIRLSESGSLSRAESFAAAIRAIREDISDPTRAHPAAWAPFVLVGDR